MQEMGALFGEIKNELSGEGIHCGWWYTLTIKSSPVPEWQRIVRGDGSQLAFATCPLDPEYRRRFAENAAVFAKIGKPEFIITEDDYGLHGGCFCKRHLAEFSRREGREWTREALVKAMEGDSPEAQALTQRWCDLKRETLADFAAEISRRELLRIVIKSSHNQRIAALLADRGALLEQVEFFDIETNDAWCRDHGPVFLKNPETGKIAMADFQYNAWGGKFTWELDNQVPSKIAKYLHCRRFAVRVFL